MHSAKTRPWCSHFEGTTTRRRGGSLGPHGGDLRTNAIRTYVKERTSPNLLWGIQDFPATELSQKLLRCAGWFQRYTISKLMSFT